MVFKRKEDDCIDTVSAILAALIEDNAETARLIISLGSLDDRPVEQIDLQ